SFSSSGYGSFETKEGGYNISFDLSYDMPSSAQIIIYGPFGMRVAEAILTGDTIIVYNRLKNEVFLAKPTAGNVRNLLMISSGEIPLGEVLIGFLPFEPHSSGNMISSQDGKLYHFTYISDDTVRKYTFDAEYMRIVSYEEIVTGNELLKIEYRDFSKVGGIYFPHSIAFNDLQRGVYARLFYKTITLNHPGSMTIDLPPDAKKIVLN
ncbi:MAG: DUF4292 domain-containing protein, partial [Candidatus Kryptoniota bacterium]